MDADPPAQGQICTPKHITYRNSFITDLPITRDTVAELAPCVRTRWKIENETFNVLKTSGYHLEHSYGQGKKKLAALLVTLNLLAFAFHTVCDQAEQLWRLARSKVSSRAQFFSRLAAITSFLIFPSWAYPSPHFQTERGGQQKNRVG